MTVDLDMMMDLRDVQVALDVARRAEMGWFDVEFTMYGCACWDKEKRYYQVSAYEEKIYDFMEKGAQNDLLSTDICMLSRKYPVPTGMKEYIALDVKKELAREMAEKFPLEFFAYLDQVAQEATEERAQPWLLEQMAQVSGCFDLKKVGRFQEMVDYAYRSRKISRSSYEEFQGWIEEEKKSMEENYIEKDIFEKTFYAIAYNDGGKLKYAINARRGYIYQKKHALEMRGVFVSPVFSDTCYYNYTLRLPQVRDWFEREAQEYINMEYMGVLQNIYQHNARITPQAFQEYLREVLERYGQEAQQTLRHYGYRWGVLGE